MSKNPNSLLVSYGVFERIFFHYFPIVDSKLRLILLKIKACICYDMALSDIFAGRWVLADFLLNAEQVDEIDENALSWLHLIEAVSESSLDRSPVYILPKIDKIPNQLLKILMVLREDEEHRDFVEKIVEKWINADYTDDYEFKLNEDVIYDEKKLIIREFRLKLASPEISACVNASGRHFKVCAIDAGEIVTIARERDQSQSIKIPNQYCSVSMTADNERCLVADNAGMLDLWHLKSAKKVTQFTAARSSAVTSLSCQPPPKA